MDQQELDDLLIQARPRSSSRTNSLAADVASDARRQTLPKVRRPRGRFGLIAGVCTAAVALTAGGTLTAYQLQIPPFQGLEPGLVRIQSAIPADYVDINDKPWTCDAFLEFRNITPNQADQVKSYVRAQDWSNLGPTAYQQAKQTPGSQTVDAVSTRFYDIVSTRLGVEAERALPGSVTTDPVANEDAYSGNSIHCEPGTR